MNFEINKYFPEEHFFCWREESAPSCLIVSPRDSNKINLIEWANSNQSKMAQAIKEMGAIVFSGFNLTNENDFKNAFTAITGSPPDRYKGDTPRKEKNSSFIYGSTAVANAVFVPLHQEVSSNTRDVMPENIAFFCVTAPKKGTGRTTIGNAEKITQRIQEFMPDFWRLISSQTLTYTARYLPSNTLLTRWIRWLNPSFATIKQRFGTENRVEVEKKCAEEGLTYKWNGRWLEVFKKGVPGIIEVDGKKLFCNQIHVDKVSPQLFGGWFNYLFGRLLLCPLPSFMQFDVKCDDGTPFSRKDAGKVLDIIREHQEERDWKAGELLVLRNDKTLHGKTPHKGQREILVAMNGTLLKNSA